MRNCWLFCSPFLCVKQKILIRVHKLFMVNTIKIKSIRNGVIFIEKHTVPLSENMREALMKVLKIA